MVGGASWEWIRIFAVGLGSGAEFESPQIVCKRIRILHVARALPSQRPPSAPKAFVAFNIRSSLVLGKKTHYRPTAQPTKKYPPTFTTALSELFFLSPDKKTNNHT
jgi:hypothetical protein